VVDGGKPEVDSRDEGSILEEDDFGGRASQCDQR